MATRIQRWGKSLALRIPKAIAAKVGLQQGDRVELSVTRGTIVVRPVPTLDERVARITDENLHDEWDTGPVVGREAW